MKRLATDTTFYLITIILCLFLALKEMINLSADDHPIHKSYAHRLSSGWMFNKQVDNSDPQ